MPISPKIANQATGEQVPKALNQVPEFPREPARDLTQGKWGTAPTRPAASQWRSPATAPKPTTASPGLLGQAQASPLTPPVMPVTRSRQLEAIAQEADRHSRRAFDLAGRKAYYAAQAEFVMALRLMAEGLDNEQRTTIHTRAFTAGLNALREAEDFLPTPDRVTADVNVASLVRSHVTPVLKSTTDGDVASLEATKCYFTFAQEQMGLAAGQEVAGSMALHGLGKLHATLASQPDCRIRACESKAVVYFQAALLACAQNHLASNDLGVLLAQCGYFGEARMALEHSLSIHRHSTGWQNLAVVYKHLGEADLARRAESLRLAAAQAEARARSGPQASPSQLVQWMDPQRFAQSYTQTPDAHVPPPVRNIGQTAGAEVKPAGVGPKLERKSLVMKPTLTDPAASRK